MKLMTSLMGFYKEKSMRFPIDCPADCPHHIRWDLSIDDYTHVCNLLNIQIDEYDCGFPGMLPLCPIERKERCKKDAVD